MHMCKRSREENKGGCMTGEEKGMNAGNGYDLWNRIQNLIASVSPLLGIFFILMVGEYVKYIQYWKCKVHWSYTTTIQNGQPSCLKVHWSDLMLGLANCGV